MPDKNFIEKTLGAKCPECGGDVTYWETQYGQTEVGIVELIDVLVCNDCGTTWERVYEYAYSRRIEN